MRRWRFRDWILSPWFLLASAGLATPPLLFNTFVPRWMPIMAIIGLTIVSLLRCLATGRILGNTPADWPLILILLTLPAGLWASADRNTTLSYTYAYIANLAVFWAITGLATVAWLHRVTPLLVIGGIALGVMLLLGLGAVGAKLPFINRDIYELLPHGFRTFWNPSGFNPNLTGGVVALFWPLALALGLRGHTWLDRILGLVGLAILGPQLLLTQSRGGLIGAMCATVAVTVLSDRRWLWVWGSGGMAVTVLILKGTPIPLDTILGSRGALNMSLQGRVELWSRAVYVIQDFPFTGVGLGMFEPVVRILYPPFIIRPDAHFVHAHNIYLHTAAEMGLPGLIGHLSLYLVLVTLLLRGALRSGTHPNRVLAIGLFGTLVAFLTHGLFEVITCATRAAIIVWGLFGLMAAVGMAPSGDKEVHAEAKFSEVPYTNGHSSCPED